MYDLHLKNAGLSPEQAKVYAYLLEKGPRQAGQVSIGTSLSRTFVYKVFEQLVDINLVEVVEDDKINRYAASHPNALVKLMEEKIKSDLNKKKTLESVIGGMVSDYNAYSHKPNVRFFEGSQGVEVLYDDIISDGGETLLFRSPLDNKTTHLREKLGDHIKRRVAKKMHLKAITPNVFKPDDLTDDLARHSDKERLVTRRILPKDKFNLPAQVFMYGKKIGITSYRNGTHTTIIDNADINLTFRRLFDYIWEMGKIDHNKLIEDRKNSKK